MWVEYRRLRSKQIYCKSNLSTTVQHTIHYMYHLLFPKLDISVLIVQGSHIELQ